MRAANWHIRRYSHRDDHPSNIDLSTYDQHQQPAEHDEHLASSECRDVRVDRVRSVRWYRLRGRKLL